MTVDELDDLLNKKSGLAALSGGIGGDSRDIEEAASKGDENGILAIKVSYLNCMFLTLNLISPLKTFLGHNP